jgi:hypothetical protein
MKRWLPLTLVAVFLLVGAALAMIVLPRFYAEDRTTAWTYQSPEHGFRITLPSKDWAEVQMKGEALAFGNRKHSTVAGVGVAKGEEGDFHKSVHQMKEYLDGNRDEIVEGPEYVEGETEAGNPYALWTMHAKGDRGDTMFLVRSLVWCKGKGLIVSVTLEGPLTMRSRVGRGEELAFYQSAARMICLSVK